MPFAASHSKATNTSDAIRAVTGDVRAALRGAEPDFAVMFVSLAHADAFEHLASRICEATGTKVLIGCTGETIVGGGEEIETGPALSLFCAVEATVAAEPFAVRFERTSDGNVMSGLPALPAEGPAPRAVILLGDPHSSAPRSLLDHFEAECPGVPLQGGMASGGRAPGENRLFCNSHEIRQGAVGLVISGGAPIRSVVSQGCRPIGTTYVITRADENVIHALGGVSPLERLHELFGSLNERDSELVRQGLHLGLAMNEYQDHFERGSFLISNVVGADRATGAIAIGTPVRIGQTVRFHVRDAQTADEDLVGLLDADRAAHQPPRGALLFSCNGRGTRLFSEPHHDAAAIRRIAGPVPLAGFFAQGEFGPVGERNHLHGFTASIMLFE
jgi:small ligand-binding sensory domain FIST